MFAVNRKLFRNKGYAREERYFALLVQIFAPKKSINRLNAELNPICHLLPLLGAHHILYFSRIRVK